MGAGVPGSSLGGGPGTHRAGFQSLARDLGLRERPSLVLDWETDGTANPDALD